MKLLIFDIDGTLTHLDGATRRAFDQAFQSVFSVPAKIDGIPMHGRTDPMIFRDCYRETGLNGDWAAAYAAFCPAYLEALPVTIERSAGKRLLPGVKVLLDELARRNAHVALALGTGNMEAGARLKIGHFGLNPFFPVGGFGDSHEKRSDLIREAWINSGRHYGRSFSCEEVWVIGDTRYDIEGGAANDFKTLGVATGGAFSFQDLVDAGANAVFSDLSDLPAVLQATGIE